MSFFLSVLRFCAYGNRDDANFIQEDVQPDSSNEILTTLRPIPDPNPTTTSETTPEHTSEPTPEPTTDLMLDAAEPVLFEDFIESTLSAGQFHSMVIRDDGSLWTWGASLYDVIGDGTNYRALTPIRVMRDVAYVASGSRSSLAITTDGRLWSWGNGVFEDTSLGRSTPTHVKDNVLSVAISGSPARETIMAICADKGLWTWGNSNNYGLLGDGNPEIYVRRTSPTRIMDDVIVISSSYFSAMAVKSDGSLWMWGLGYYNGEYVHFNSTPIMIMEDVKYVSHNTGVYMVIKNDGSLWAWGVTLWGGIGDGTSEARYTPVHIMDDVASVSVGRDHTLAIKTDGSLWAWGSNNDGQIGDGTVTQFNRQAEITRDNTRLVPIKVMENVVSASAGDSHSMAITFDGSLWVWGSNDFGQLGDGTYSIINDAGQHVVNNDKYVPTKIMDGVMLPSTAQRLLHPTQQFFSPEDLYGIKMEHSQSHISLTSNDINDLKSMVSKLTNVIFNVGDDHLVNGLDVLLHDREHREAIENDIKEAQTTSNLIAHKIIEVRKSTVNNGAMLVISHVKQENLHLEAGEYIVVSNIVFRLTTEGYITEHFEIIGTIDCTGDTVVVWDETQRTHMFANIADAWKYEQIGFE